MSSGWIKLHRKMVKWEWYDDANTFRLFVHLLIMANHKETKWRGLTIPRGQLLTGRKLLAAELGISEQSVRTSLARLKSTSEITIKSTNKFSVITVCNYCEYQRDEREDNQQNNQQANQQSTNNQPTTNQQLTTSKNANNGEEGKEHNPEIVDFVGSFIGFVNKECGRQAPKDTDSLHSSSYDVVEKLIRLDGYSLDDIKGAMRWAVKDSFWSSNARSLAQLRKKSQSNGLTKFQNIYTAWKGNGQEDLPKKKSNAEIQWLKAEEMVKAGRYSEALSDNFDEMACAALHSIGGLRPIGGANRFEIKALRASFMEKYNA